MEKASGVGRGLRAPHHEGQGMAYRPESENPVRGSLLLMETLSLLIREVG